jgi:hypothetical protein
MSKFNFILDQPIEKELTLPTDRFTITFIDNSQLTKDVILDPESKTMLLLSEHEPEPSGYGIIVDITDSKGNHLYNITKEQPLVKTPSITIDLNI